MFCSSFLFVFLLVSNKALKTLNYYKTYFACVADALNLLNGLGECVGRLQRRLNLVGEAMILTPFQTI